MSQRLLVAAVADPSERVRTAVLRALHSTTALDDYMAQVRSPLERSREALRGGMGMEVCLGRGLVPETAYASSCLSFPSHKPFIACQSTPFLATPEHTHTQSLAVHQNSSAMRPHSTPFLATPAPTLTHRWTVFARCSSP